MPLSGIRVVELAQNLAGPYCGQILADLGADVIKIEPPGGDAARRWGPPFWGGDSPLWLGVNRNKRSAVVDLKTPRGIEVVDRLLDTADVVIAASRAGAMESLGLGADQVRSSRPALIYAEVTAYGLEGPLSSLPGYDPLMQAHAGLMSITGYADGGPARSGASIVDLTTGMWGAVAVLGALAERSRTGKGARVTLALLDAAVALVSHQLTGYLASGEVPGRWGTGLAMIAPYRAFPTKDGRVMIATGSDGTFRRLAEALGLEGVAEDARFATNAERVRHRATLAEIISDATAAVDTTALLDRLRAHGVPCSAIHDMAQVASDPQVRASGMVRPSPRPDTPEYAEIAPPYRFDGERPRSSLPPPTAGQHTAEILEMLGFDPAEADALGATADPSARPLRPSAPGSERSPGR